MDAWEKSGLAAREGTSTDEFFALTIDALRAFEARIGKLEARLATVEHQKGVTLADAFQGPHLTGKLYQSGQLVQRNRKTWLAMVETREQPSASSDWRELDLGQGRAG